jgi:prepilin-type N-terminal cleavage/methylation domain-containing protein
MQSMKSNRHGLTLLELVVVLTILGIVLGVTGLALGALQSPRESQMLMELRAARADAIQSGAQRVARGVLFLPDGRGIGPGVDPLTGAPNAK